MKTIGLLGGMSWESTASYYKAINEGVRAKLGGLHSAKIALYSVDFEEIERLQREDQWHKAADILVNAAKGVEAAGADCLLICTNTMHKVATQIQAGITIPILHIADATAARLVADGVTQAGLLGTRFTMEQDFYKGRITEQFGMHILVPDATERRQVNTIIYEELCRGVITEDSRRRYLEIIEALGNKGAQAIILGCTEIGLLIQPGHTRLPIYDTTAIHADAAVAFALGE